MTKDDIKAWLRQRGQSRDWLAEQIGVNKRTVDNWLSSPKVIPEAKFTLIHRAIANEEARAAKQLSPVDQVFSIEVDKPTFRTYSEAAKAANLTLEDWAIQALNEAADSLIAAESPPANITPYPMQTEPDDAQGLKVAEQVKDYGGKPA